MKTKYYEFLLAPASGLCVVVRSVAMAERWISTKMIVTYKSSHKLHAQRAQKEGSKHLSKSDNIAIVSFSCVGSRKIQPHWENFIQIFPIQYNTNRILATPRSRSRGRDYAVFFSLLLNF